MRRPRKDSYVAGVSFDMAFKAVFAELLAVGGDVVLLTMVYPACAG
jgi:hypothetical protein